VGLSEEEAKRSGLDVKIARFPNSALGKSRVIGSTEGLVKVIGDRNTGRVLGVHILGADASNLIGEAVLAIKSGISAEELGSAILPHPTLSEGLGEACHVFEEMGIHAL
jgi:dihydrolipoamide dehydrogenase